jgi:hypothetical protein
MRAVMTGNAKSGSEQSRPLYIGDIIEGQEAADQVAAGNADLIEENSAEAPVEERPEVASPKSAAKAKAVL